MRRAHIAGVGAVTGFGAGYPRLADAIFVGETAVRPRARTAPMAGNTAVAAEIPAGDAPPEAADLAFAIARRAAEEALAQGGIDPASAAVLVASTKADFSGVDGAGAGLGHPAQLARRLADELGMAGTLASVSCACASGVVGIANAARQIARGEAERVLVVGVDVLYEFVLAGFSALQALDPGPCRPFDISRLGISLGEGAAAVVLSMHEAESVGIAVTGHGGANDACHVTHPDPEGRGVELAVARAMAHAGVEPTAVDLLHLHGTATMANDSSEACGLVRAFGGTTPPAFGTKAQTGHTLGAAGVVESLLAAEALRRGQVPANVGLEEPGVDRRLDLVREGRALSRARCAVKVSSGFGGVQAALVLEA